MSNFRKTLLPAEPGFYAINFDQRGSEVFVQNLHVIAWAIEFGFADQVDVKPICVDQLSPLYEGAILSPNGRVIIRGSEWWNSYDEYISYFASIHGVDYRNVVTSASAKAAVR